MSECEYIKTNGVKCKNIKMSEESMTCEKHLRMVVKKCIFVKMNGETCNDRVATRDDPMRVYCRGHAKALRTNEKCKKNDCQTLTHSKSGYCARCLRKSREYLDARQKYMIKWCKMRAEQATISSGTTLDMKAEETEQTC